MTSHQNKEGLEASAVAFLLEMATYFERRPTNGEDSAFWANVTNKRNCEGIASLVSSLREENERLQGLVDRLKIEAQGHASEARTANSTIYEIYRALSGGTGEPGNWNGAEPARQYVAASQAREKIYREGLEPFVKYLDEVKIDLNNKGEQLPDADDVGWVYLTIGDFRRAPRPLPEPGAIRMRKLPPSHNLDDAITIASQVHAGQRDKGGAPYILHPIRVMMQMATDQERIVALLHDTVEDSDWFDLAEVEVYFGSRIAEAVDALTKRDGEDYDDYLARVADDELATTVKLADLRDNSDLSRLGRDPDESDRRRLDKYLRARAVLQMAQETRHASS